VSNGFPPYELFEFPPPVGKIPPHRTDTGAFLIADAYGAARTIYVKDVDGVYTRDPATAADGDAKFLSRVGAAELLAMDLPSLPIDRLVLDLMANAKHQEEIQIVNGLTRGNVTKALRGEHVGTIIYKDS
jgi:molybdenum storage protein